MTLFDMKAFYGWLSEASEAELLGRRDELVALLPQLTEPDALTSTRRYVRKIEAELVDRRITGR